MATPCSRSDTATTRQVQAHNLVILLSSPDQPAERHWQHGEVVDIDYYGHDQMVVVKLEGGEVLRLRLLSRPGVEVGQDVGVATRGQPLVFPRA